jgi:RNase P subunit RPR2
VWFSGEILRRNTDFSVAPAPGIPYNQIRGPEYQACQPVRSVVLTTKEETRVALTCPSCGNDQNFLVKTLQMHLVHLEDSRVDVSEEGRPGVIEVLCDECETALNFDEVDEAVRKELLLTLGAR